MFSFDSPTRVTSDKHIAHSAWKLRVTGIRRGELTNTGALCNDAVNNPDSIASNWGGGGDKKMMNGKSSELTLS